MTDQPDDAPFPADEVSPAETENVFDAAKAAVEAVEGDADAPVVPSEDAPLVDLPTVADDAAAAVAETTSKPEREPALPVAKPGRLTETSPEPQALPLRTLQRTSRRDFLMFGAGAIVAAGGVWGLLPDDTRGRILTPKRALWLDSLEARAGLSADRRERALNRVLTFDDDVAEALFSRTRSVRTYGRSDITPLRNNYEGRTPGPEYLATWTLALTGVAGGDRILSLAEIQRMPQHEQITRLCCVEGWSAVAWWKGVRFADLLAAFPPAPGMRWAAMESSVNLDGGGHPDPYYVSIDLETARHPQALLATHQDNRPLSLAHGAPMRLVVPMKLGLKNIKAVTKIAYVREEPRDFWGERGYSKYDGL